MSPCDEIDELLSGYLDNELTQDKRQLVEVHLKQCDKCQARFAEIRSITTSIASLSLDEMSPEQWRKTMNDLTVRSTRGIGWLLLIAGSVVLTGYSVYEFLMSDVEPFGVKLAVSAVAAGFVGLFVSVLRQRLIARKTDKYKNVEI